MNSSASSLERELRHPLDGLPGLSRFRPSVLRNLIYTGLMSVAFALIFSFITKLNVPTQSLSTLIFVNGVFSFSIGYCIHGFSVLSDRLITRFRPDATGRQILVSDALATFVGTTVGYWIASTALDLGDHPWFGMTIGAMWVVLFFWALAGAQRQRAINDLALERERSARVEAQRVMTSARLQLLQAQIEPHFLFNTLANLSSLIETEPKKARKMLDELTLLLRSSLDSTRSASTSLRKELQVIEAYLSVLKVRMGERLQYEIDAPSELLEMQVPSMLLQPIVENAVKHGVEPQVAGGVVRVQVKRHANHLELIVLDNGVGFAPNSKDNVGLGAVRERLQMQFGADAALTAERVQSDWTRVAIRIPMPS